MGVSSFDADPVFWWWAELGGHRVVVVTDEHIAISGVLDGDHLRALEANRRSGRFDLADLGAGAFVVALVAVEAVVLVPERSLVTVHLRDARTTFAFSPGEDGVAVGVVQELRRRHGVGEVRATEVDPGPVADLAPSSWSRVTVLLAAGGLVGVVVGSTTTTLVASLLGLVLLAAGAIAGALHLRHGRAVAASRPPHTEIRVRIHAARRRHHRRHHRLMRWTSRWMPTSPIRSPICSSEIPAGPGSADRAQPAGGRRPESSANASTRLWVPRRPRP